MVLAWEFAAFADPVVVMVTVAVCAVVPVMLTGVVTVQAMPFEESAPLRVHR